jgi:hypothetical protein
MDDSTVISGETDPARGPVPDASPAVSARELVAVALIVALADVSIFRGGGYSGVAAFIAGIPLLLRLGSTDSRTTRDLVVLTILLAASAVRLLWCGSSLATAVATGLVLMFAMALAARRPFVLELLAFVGEVQANAYAGLAKYRRTLLAGSLGRPISPTAASFVGFVLPAAAVTVFSLLFLFANPDLAKRFGDEIAHTLERLRQWVAHLSIGEILFCLASGWLAVGLIRAKRVKSNAVEDGDGSETPSGPLSDALYSGFRNTLVAVAALFAAYLVFEFQTLWFRTFPKGFYYAGYAHQGAFYLTIALGLATLTLSAIFRGRTFNDPGLPSLRRWGVLWAIENLVLALAVYNRLFIYIDFNGMTRMRSIGLLGVSAVVAGCLLVVVKIAQNRNSTWLIRRQLWVLAFAIYLYAVLPIDAWVIRYNVRKVLAGNLPPSVQLSEHRTSTEGLLELSPLLTASDITIRDGVRAWLAGEWQKRKGAEPADWSHFQLADRQLKEQLAPLSASLEVYADEHQRLQDWEAFKKYAYQWY